LKQNQYWHVIPMKKWKTRLVLLVAELNWSNKIDKRRPSTAQIEQKTLIIVLAQPIEHEHHETIILIHFLLCDSPHRFTVTCNRFVRTTTINFQFIYRSKGDLCSEWLLITLLVYICCIRESLICLAHPQSIKVVCVSNPFSQKTKISLGPAQWFANSVTSSPRFENNIY
jgi:hypothetical protein